MRIKLDQPMTDFYGNPLKVEGKDVTMGGLLALMLMRTAEGDPVRHSELADAVRAPEGHDMLRSDIEYLIAFLRKAPQYTHELRAPIIKALQKFRDDCPAA